MLCLHGFTGTPYEMAPLAHALAASGYTVSAPLLAGHGEVVGALAATTWHDWLASAQAAFDQLRAATGERAVAVAGLSMGGLLALRLARAHPAAVSALVLMSVPLRLPPWKRGVLRVFSHLPDVLRRQRLASLRKRGGSDITDERARAENPSAARMPLGGLADLIVLADLVRHDLPTITAPALVAHGERDRTVPQSASFELAGSLAAATVERLWLPRSGHVVTLDVERGQLCAAVTRFLSAHLAPVSRAHSHGSNS